MHRALPILFLLVACGHAEQADPFAAPARADPDASSPTRAVVIAPPLIVPHTPERSMNYGFAANASGELSVFDRSSAATLARLALEGPVIDIAWDARHERALVVVQAPDETRLLEAVIFDGEALTVVARSEPINGARHVRAWNERVLLLSQELATSFWLLDQQLSPVAPSKALFLPASFAPAPDHERLYALDGNRFEAGLDHDALLRLSFDGSWQLEQWLLPAPGRPGSRLAAGGDPDTLWLVRKPLDTGSFEIAEIDALTPQPPSFVGIEVAVEPSSLSGVVLEPQQRALIAALSCDELGGGDGALAILPLVVGAPASLIAVDGYIESSAWPVRQLAYDAVTSRVLVATSGGVQAWLPSGTANAPALALDSGFAGSELRPPFVLALATGT